MPRRFIEHVGDGRGPVGWVCIGRNLPSEQSAPANDSSTFMAGDVLDPAPGAVSAAVPFTLPALTCPSTRLCCSRRHGVAPDGNPDWRGNRGDCSGPRRFRTPLLGRELAVQRVRGRTRSSDGLAGDTSWSMCPSRPSGGKVWIKDVTLKKGQTAIADGAANALVRRRRRLVDSEELWPSSTLLQRADFGTPGG